MNCLSQIMDGNTDRVELLKNLSEKYRKVRNLLNIRIDDQVSANESTLKYKNEAIDILKEMQFALINELKNDENEDDTLNDMLAVIYLDIGLVYIDIGELKIGEEHLMLCTQTLAGKETNSRRILPLLSALNELGIIWFQWSSPNKAETFLKRAEEIYKEYMELKHVKPVAMAALVNIVDDEGLDPNEILDKIHTFTLFYLAQIYGDMKDHYKSAKYCHMTLQRRINHTDFDHIDWALNAATLAQFFMEKQGFHQARHHLAAASHILHKYEASLGDLPEELSEDAKAAKWERYRHRSADVARCWAKYGLLLMEASRERLIKCSESSDSEKYSDCEQTDLDDEKNVIFKNIKFATLEKDIESICNRVTDKYLLDFNDARGVFLDVQHWLKEAQKYYNFESHASDYIQIIEDISQSYKCLSFFEDNEERQAKMHKRRIDILVPVVEELNVRYYQAECRQIWIELAETYSAILNIKLDKLRASNDKPTPGALTKINNLTQSAIGYYQKFLDSLKESENLSAVMNFSEEMVCPALSSYFHLGTLYNKIITTDKHAQLENVKKSFEAYKFFIDYCELHNELKETMKQEFSVCEDLVNLLPLKINKLMQAISAK